MHFSCVGCPLTLLVDTYICGAQARQLPCCHPHRSLGTVMFVGSIPHPLHLQDVAQTGIGTAIVGETRQSQTM